MLSSLKKAWKWPIGYWFVDKVKSSVQAQLIRIAVSECQKYGINVLSVTCDGVYVNFSSFQILGCNLNQLFEHLKPILILIQIHQIFTLPQMLNIYKQQKFF